MAKKKKDSNDWGERLKAVLSEKEISLRKAASICGVQPSVMNGWFKSSSPTDLMAVKKLSDEIGVSFTWLLTGEHEANNDPTVAELFDESLLYEGLARIRIDRLILKDKKKKG